MTRRRDPMQLWWLIILVCTIVGAVLAVFAPFVLAGLIAACVCVAGLARLWAWWRWER